MFLPVVVQWIVLQGVVVRSRGKDRHGVCSIDVMFRGSRVSGDAGDDGLKWLVVA